LSIILLSWLTEFKKLPGTEPSAHPGRNVGVTQGYLLQTAYNEKFTIPSGGKIYVQIGYTLMASHIKPFLAGVKGAVVLSV